MPTILLTHSPDMLANYYGGQQAFDTVHQVETLIAGRVPEGAANSQPAQHLSCLRRA